LPNSIDTAGDITGLYRDASYLLHGFVRAATGTITMFEAPGAGTGAYTGTAGFSVNTAGDIAGTNLDTHYVYHGFVRTP
jgi:predicted membrane protein